MNLLEDYKNQIILQKVLAFLIRKVYNRMVRSNKILNGRNNNHHLANTNKINNNVTVEKRCGTCMWFDGEDEEDKLCFCDEKEMWCYYWGNCPRWETKNK